MSAFIPMVAHGSTTLGHNPETAGPRFEQAESGSQGHLVPRLTGVVTWADVERVALTLPETGLGEAHSGEPAVLVRSQIFARSREKSAVLQFWVADEQLVDGYVAADGATYWGARGYSRTVVMARLSALDESDLRDALVESWRARATATLRRQHADLR
jgi:hypothetical protein